ncbi:ABC transporter substrate-binding protein [Massilia sp. W12]|uniref:ABC transporter substrate-binding protein n=1 Tax=Massilia sp. W12 TaxID=3126507 RepID=UPI0030CC4E4A
MRSILTFCLILLLSAQAGAAQHKIMMLLYRGQTEAEKGFMDYLKKRKIEVEYIIRDAQGDKSKVAEYVREINEVKPDLVYAFGTTLTSELVGLQGEVDPARHITTIPVVFNIVADPVGAGLVRQLQSSGRNLTGASHLVPLEAQLKALQAMRKTSVLGVLYSQEKNSLLAIEELKKMAPRFGMQLQLTQVDAKAEGAGLARGVQEALAKKPQFLYLPSDSFLIKNADDVVKPAMAAKVPVFAATEAPIRNNGALLGVVSTYYNVGELAAYKAEQILTRKKKPEQIPVEVLHRFTYLVNMSSAKKLKVYPPLSVMKIAETVTDDAIDARE